MGDALRDAMEMPQGTGTEIGVEQELKPLVAALADRLRHARGKHDWPQVQHARYYALTVLGDEVGELRQAITHEEGRDREMDEALDCIAVLARFWLGDHLPEGEK